MSQQKVLVPDGLQERAVAILTGGVDAVGTLLVTIQIENVEQCELVALLLYYLNLTTQQPELPSNIACLADLQNANKDDITVFVGALETVELSRRGRISAVYLLKPKTKDKSHFLKKLLGLKPSKKNPRIPLFKVLLFKTRRDILTQIEASQLTEDFGGTLQYDHQAWMYFVGNITPCMQAAEELLLRLPSVRDRVELLQEYDIVTQTSDQLIQLRQELLQQYQTMIKELRLVEMIEQCKQALFCLERPEESHLGRVHWRLLQEATERIRLSFASLMEDQAELTSLWAAAEERIVLAKKLQKCKERAQEIHKTIKRKYEPLLKDHPAAGKTLSQAELYRTHFTAELYEPAKDLLSQATETLEEMQRLSVENPEATNQHGTDITRLLSDVIHPFTEHLQHLQDTYVSVHIFHLLLEKSMNWYKKVLKFLPDMLKHRLATAPPDKLLHTPPEWGKAVESFLCKHPAPREKHIIKLDSDIPRQIDKKLKQQAHCLALRVQFLQRLLKGRCLPVKLVAAAFRWKEEIFGSSSPSPTKRHVGRMKQIGRSSARNSHLSQQCQEQRDETLIESNCADQNSPYSDKMKSDFLPPRHNTSVSDTESFARQTFTYSDPNYHLVSNKKKKSYSPVQRYNTSVSDTERYVQRKFTSNEPNQHMMSTNKNNSHGQNTSGSHTERFVRLTFTPNEPNIKNQRVFSFDDFPLGREYPGSESGIEVMEVSDDPYDSIVSKIKEVSVSNLPSELKLKYVTELLSCSLKKRYHPKTESQIQHIYFSEEDGINLPRESMGNTSTPDWRYDTNPVSSIKAVSKMKQKLAQSLDDLQDIGTDPPQRVLTSRSVYSLDQQGIVQNPTVYNQAFEPQDSRLVLEDFPSEHQTYHEFSLDMPPTLRSAQSLHELSESFNNKPYLNPSLAQSVSSLNQYQEPWDRSSDLEFKFDPDKTEFGYDDWLSASDATSESDSINLQLDLKRLHKCQENRLVEEMELVNERGRYGNIQVEAESVSQDEVESSLRRSEIILNQEEEALQYEKDVSVSTSMMLGLSSYHSGSHVRKTLSADQGYDSTSSLPVTPSHSSNCSTLETPVQRSKGARESRSDKREVQVEENTAGSIQGDPLDGPDFF